MLLRKARLAPLLAGDAAGMLGGPLQAPVALTLQHLPVGRWRPSA